MKKISEVLHRKMVIYKANVVKTDDPMGCVMSRLFFNRENAEEELRVFINEWTFEGDYFVELVDYIRNTTKIYKLKRK